MNRAEKLELILRDDELRKQEEQNRLLKLQQLLNMGGFANEMIEDDFQHTEVKITQVPVEIYSLTVPDERAAVITYVGNDWYPGLTYHFSVDNYDVGSDIQREIAPTNNPTEVKILAKNNIIWRATNDGDEARNVGIVTGGHFVPKQVYDELADIFVSLSDDTTFIGERSSEPGPLLPSSALNQ